LSLVTTPPSPHAWLFTLLRAATAAVLALLVTFSADHSTGLGFVTLAVFGAVTGGILIVGTFRGAYPRAFLLVVGVHVLGAVAALVMLGSSVAALLFLVSAVFAVAGIAELIVGLRARANAAARDWIFVGALGAALSVGALLVPADYDQAIVLSDPSKVVPDLTASTIVVGLLGAYWAIAAVYLAIAGLSLKWSKQTVGSTAHG
jgi:uncharacterized membrane protein HdeD (DUF308 family)